MNYPFKKIRAVLTPIFRPGRRLEAVWVRDPRSGRLVQTWREVEDGGSCTGRPRGPHPLATQAGGGFRLAA